MWIKSENGHLPNPNKRSRVLSVTCRAGLAPRTPEAQNRKGPSACQSVNAMIIIIISVFTAWWNKGRYSSLATAGSALGSAGHRLMEMDGAPSLNSSLSSAKPIRILSVIAQIAADSPCHQFLPFIFSHPFPVISSNHP